eukprot:CAMPEP_0197548392 /NCGR_PEP_ID=MMETSP1320-20131121/2529_1 /TAXON_ID=91990 /ORGANISM="Bolidomonas sp., Strain RCC2347" /LENGTH=254 /DNA_ID=CAMNT_0043108393 /DNA_START=26 /DNA_END=790 /DNA_ORIENTATION=+
MTDTNDQETSEKLQLTTIRMSAESASPEASNLLQHRGDEVLPRLEKLAIKEDVHSDRSTPPPMEGGCTPVASNTNAPPPNMTVADSWRRIFVLLNEGRDVSLWFAPTTKEYFEDLNGEEVVLTSGLDESLVYKFIKKVVKKSDVRDGGGSFSIRIEIVDHEDGPAVLEYTAKNTNRLMNQLKSVLPLLDSPRGDKYVINIEIHEDALGEHDVQIFRRRCEFATPTPFVHYVICSVSDRVGESPEPTISWNELDK